MTWLFLSIICSTLIFIIFKLFDRYQIDNLQAIVINYFVAFSVGYIASPFSLNPSHYSEKPWLWSVFILGFMFISLFQLMAWVAQKIGVSSVSITVKMSLVIPIALGIWLYAESLSVIQVIGVGAALAAVYLSTRKKKAEKQGSKNLLLPLILFLGSGLLDSFLKYNQERLVHHSEDAQFASLIFLTAGSMGTLLLISKLIAGSQKLHIRNLIAGLILGIINYGSIFFLLKALGADKMESTIIFPINNVGIVALSVLTGWLVFKETISKQNKIGIALAILSIFLIAIETIL